MSIFSTTKKRKLKRTAFNLSHEKKCSFEMGQLYPTLVQEVVPGDTFEVSSETVIRFAPMIAPIMHRINVYTHFFFVPNRLVWDEWEDFITGEEELEVPTFQSGQINSIMAAGTLGEAFGLPETPSILGSDIKLNQLPWRAYNLIFNEYYRDENLVDEVLLGNNTILMRAWEKNYFTSALPFAQKGGEASIDLDISYTPKYKADGTLLQAPDGGTINSSGTVNYDNVGQTGQTRNVIDAATPNGDAVIVDNLEDAQDLDSSININEIRLAEKVQRWLERNARAGSRYVEHLLAHWNVKSSDARLNRPEFLGGGVQPVVVSEVLSTAESDVDGNQLAVGQMAGHGISVGKSNKFKKFFEEHGFIIGIISVLPKMAFMQGIDKSFLRTDKFDYYFPDFAHLGEQEVLGKELYYQPSDDTGNNSVFGYQSRFAEYKYKPSIVTGDFRKTLNHWHMAQKYDNRPELNSSFITSNPTDRIWAVSAESGYDHLYVQIYHKITAIRPMPYYGTPKL